MSYASDALIDAQEREINKLKAENDQLKRFARLDESTIGSLNSYIDDINAENDKLRELAKDLFGNVLFSCSECTYSIRDVRTCDNKGCLNYKTYQKIRELGIEVER